ncbi:MAG: hypothetical protein GF329_19770 [Candidatus Lokiarchaeota archaeon]|nr:hypothetical protein [Candidatus Lokiarchaeota archaeon]
MKDHFTGRIRDLHLLKRGEPIGDFEKILVDRMIDGKHVVEPNSKNMKISELIKKDVNNIYYLNFSIVRPIIGTFGSGKSMTLKQAAMLIENRVENTCIAFIELTKYGGEDPSVVITHVFKEIIDNIALSLRDFVLKNKNTLQSLAQKRLKDGLELLGKEKEDFSRGKMILKGEIHEEYGRMNQSVALNMLEELIELLGRNKYLLVLLFDELERFMTISDEKTKQSFIGTYLRSITDKTSANPKTYVVFTCDKEKFDEIPLIVPEVERTIREYILYLNEFSEDEFFEVANKIYDHILAPFQNIIEIMKPTPALCAMLIRDISNFTPSELVTRLASYYIKNYNLDAVDLLKIEKGYKREAYYKFRQRLIIKGYKDEEIKRNVRFHDFKWDAIGLKRKGKKSQRISIGQFTILNVNIDYVNDFLSQFLILKEEEEKRNRNVEIDAVLIAPSFADDVPSYCITQGIQWVQFTKKPEKLERFKGIVSDKQIKIPRPEKISDSVPESSSDKKDELKRVLASLTATKIRSIAKQFNINKIYGVKKSTLIKKILQELPERIEEEIDKLSR